MSRPQILTVKKLIAMSPEMAAEIEEYRFAFRIKTEAEAIRKLIEIGLAVEAEAAG